MGKLASILESKDFLKIFVDIAQQRFLSIKVQNALVYMIDTVPESAINQLAVQFDVDGVKGLAASSSIEEKRNIIRRSIELHRYKGTPYAVKEAVKSLGFLSVDILEGLAAVELSYSGVAKYNGLNSYGDGAASPFNFSVTLGAEEIGDLTPEKRQALIDIINEYKNIRSRLSAIAYNVTIRPQYNNKVTYDGTVNYDYEMYTIAVGV